MTPPRGNQTLVPEHDGSHVADGRKRTARVGCNDDERGIDQTVFAVVNQLAQDHHHHNGRSHVVEDGRKDERHRRDAPQQSALALCLEHVAHEVEAAVLVHGFYNGHRPHQKEQRCGRASQMSLNDRTGSRGDSV